MSRIIHAPDTTHYDEVDFSQPQETKEPSVSTTDTNHSAMKIVEETHPDEVAELN